MEWPNVVSSNFYQIMGKGVQLLTLLTRISR
jgi:hypothetical protein